MAKEISLQPLGNRVLIKPEDIQEKTPGGLVIPPNASDEKISVDNSTDDLPF